MTMQERTALLTPCAVTSPNFLEFAHRDRSRVIQQKREDHKDFAHRDRSRVIPQIQLRLILYFFIAAYFKTVYTNSPTTIIGSEAMIVY